ncbi:MAG TPA: hypothetical protein VFS21_01645 [Roseiflexaceae bacterium]|nr:hypothetical protein [Roseiflexaceae bacterium]
MERRRNILGWIAIGLGVLALVGVFAGASHRPAYSESAPVFAERSGRSIEQDSQQFRTPHDGPHGERQDFRTERHEQFRPVPPEGFAHGPKMRVMHERGRGHWWLWLPLMLLGSILRFALFAAVAYFVVRWLQKRDAARDRKDSPPSDPPYTGGTTSL